MDQVKQRLNGNMRQLEKFTQPGTVDMTDRKKFEGTLSTMTWDLSRILAAADSPDWAHPSAKRLAISRDIADVIAPYNGLLARVAFGPAESNSQLPTYTRGLLEYSKPDAELLKSLKEQVASGSLEKSGAAADLLFEYRALDEEDKAALRRRFAGVSGNQDLRAGWVLRLSKFGMPEAIPVLGKMLETPLPPEKSPHNARDLAVSDYCVAAEAIEYFGPRAKVLRPLLKQRLAEIKNGMQEPGRGIYAPQLQGAIDEVDGRRPMAIPLGMNGSGPLVGEAPAQIAPAR